MNITSKAEKKIKLPTSMGQTVLDLRCPGDQGGGWNDKADRDALAGSMQRNCCVPMWHESKAYREEETNPTITSTFLNINPLIL
jgi:hypothetical protein